MNHLDRALSYVAPRYGAQRLRARLVLDSFRRYEGAATGRRTEGWKTSPGSINRDTALELPILRQRSLDLVANNPFAKRAVHGISGHVVGAGILAQISGSRQEWLFRQWAESTACDAAGSHDFYGIQDLVMRTVIAAGECLVRRRPRRSGLRVPLELELIEPDLIDSAKQAENGQRLVQGIEFDHEGKRLAYWLFDEHPGEAQGCLIESRRIPAADVLHIFESLRPGQVRGIPWLAPVMLRLRDFDDYEDAQLVRQKIASCLVGVIHDADGFDDIEDLKKRQELSHFEPGTWQHLPPGKSVTFSNPPSISGYSEYAVQILHGIAAGLGLPYEVLTGDYSRVNYSSARLAFLEFYRSVDRWRWHMLVPKLLNPVYQWFANAVDLAGLGRSVHQVSWVPPKREYVDPAKEIEATKEAIKGGLMSLSQAIRESGSEPSQVFDEMQNDYQELQSRGLKVDTDIRTELAIKAHRSRRGNHATSAKNRSHGDSSGKLSARDGECREADH